MQLLSRREYNLILRALDSYNLYMNNKEKELRETLEDKLYYNLYNPKDGVAQTEAKLPDLDINLSALYDIHTEKDLSEVTENENLELPDLSNNLDDRPVIENGQYISF